MTRFSIFEGRAKARPLLFRRALPFVILASRIAAADLPPAPRATVAERRFEFGRIRRGDKVVHAFRVHNSGNAPLAFTGAQLSMPGMTCRVSPPLDPGADGAITVEWKTDRVQGTVDGVAEISTNDPASPSIALGLSGRIEGPLEIDPLPALFLSVFRGEDLRRELALTSHREEPLSLRLVPGEGAHFRAALAPVEEGKRWRLIVRPNPDVAPGHYEETLAIESGDAAVGRVVLPVHLFVKPDVYANPDDLDFGDLRLSSSAPGGALPSPQTFFVKKRSGVFRILRVRSDVPFLDLRVDPDARPSGSFQIDAALRSGDRRPGVLDGKITIETDDPRFPLVEVRVRGRIVE